MCVSWLGYFYISLYVSSLQPCLSPLLAGRKRQCNWVRGLYIVFNILYTVSMDPSLSTVCSYSTCHMIPLPFLFIWVNKLSKQYWMSFLDLIYSGRKGEWTRNHAGVCLGQPRALYERIVVPCFHMALTGNLGTLWMFMSIKMCLTRGKIIEMKGKHTFHIWLKTMIIFDVNIASKT